MSEPHIPPEIIDRICGSDTARSTKIVRLYAVSMLDPRGQAGVLAWEKIGQMVGEDYASALAYLCSLMMHQNPVQAPKPDRWRELVPELKEFTPAPTPHGAQQETPRD